MGLLDDAIPDVLNAVGLGSLVNKKVKRGPTGPDFPEGMKIVEIIDGRPAESDAIVLVGAFLPKDELEFGGTQRLQKDYYPGSSEPTVQVLGPRESDVTVKGTFKAKRFDPDLAGACQEYQELMDAMRIRGNLVRVTLGEWKRYGFLEETKFKMRTLRDIDYELKISVVGFNAPLGWKLLVTKDESVTSPNKELIAKALVALQNGSDIPESMPQSLSELLNGAIGEIAEAVGLVTGFVESVIDDAEKLQASAHRALGLIRNARATISRNARRIGAIKRDAETLGAQFKSEADKTTATYKNLGTLHKVEATNVDLQSILATLHARFAAIVRSTPLRRHFVTLGDTLQKLSIKYYGSADNWKRIYDHNKLQSTELVKGTVLEIPRL